MDPIMDKAVDFVIKYMGMYPDRIPTFTDKLTISLADQYEKIPPERQREFLKWVHDTYEDLRKQLEPLQKIQNKKLRLKEYHEALDDIMSRNRHREVKCKKGCFGCCMQKVSAVDLETDVITDMVVSGQVSIDIAKLKKQASAGQRDAGEYQSALAKEDAMCVFLKDGNCSIYENRPIMCRTYMVISDPQYCDPYDHPSYNVSVINHMLTEFVVSAIFGETGEEGNFHAKLLHNLQKAGFNGA